MKTVRRVAALGALFCAALTAPAAALAAPGWSPPRDVGVPSGALAPTIAYGSGGIATVAYIQVTSTSPLVTALHVGVIAPGGSYVDEVTIPSTPTGAPATVSLSEAPDGAAVVAYETVASASGTSDEAAYAIERPAGSVTWGSPVSITPPLARDGVHPAGLTTAISADGSAAIGIERNDPADASPGGDRIDVAVAEHGGAWESPVEVSLSGEDNESPALAFDDADNLTVAFSSAAPAATERPTAELATRSGTTGAWGAPIMVSPPSSSDFLGSPLQLGVAPDGSAVVAYQFATYSTPSRTLDLWATTRLGASGQWTTPADVTPGSESAGIGAVGVSPSDEAYVIYDYEGQNPGLECIGAVRAHVGGSFSPADCVSPLNYQPFAIAGVSFLGNDAYFAFTGKPNGGSENDVEADRWADSAATPDTPTTLVSPEYPASVLGLTVEPDQNGGMPVLFSLDGGQTIDASAWDAAGPNLTSSSVPTTAVAGQAITLEAKFADLWSSPATAPSWSFGDGSSAGGTSVMHTYATAGTYVAQAVSMDALGNTTTQPFTITVTPAPAPATIPVKMASTLELTALRQSHASWLEKRRAQRGKSHPAVGTAFHFSLSAAAAVTMTFSARRPGRKLGSRCVAQTSGNVKHARCRLNFSVAETISGHTGANTVTFLGALRGHAKLIPGSYSVTFTARSGPLTSNTSKLHFAILRR